MNAQQRQTINGVQVPQISMEPERLFAFWGKRETLDTISARDRGNYRGIFALSGVHRGLYHPYSLVDEEGKMEGKREGMSESIDGLTPLRARRQGQNLNQQEKLEAQANFLGRFAEDGNVTEACKAAGVSRTIVYQWKDKNKAFAELFAEAEAQSNDAIRAEIYRRAVTGWQEPMVSAGKLVCNVTKYSDALLMFHAKARMPEYREKQPDVNVTVDVEGAKARLIAKLGQLPDEEDSQSS